MRSPSVLTIIVYLLTMDIFVQLQNIQLKCLITTSSQISLACLLVHNPYFFQPVTEQRDDTVELSFNVVFKK